MLALLVPLLLLQALPGDLVAQGPRCAAAATRCFGLHVHLATDGVDGAAVRDAAWVTDQVARANELFADMGVGFEIASADLLDGGLAHITDRAARDALGRGRLHPGSVDVFVVAQLDNVDAPGEIRGVHWRDRRARSRRWIILSGIAPRHVLAHELGHYFGLPHSLARGSLMNTSGNDPTPREERGFLAAERARIAKSAARFAATKELRLRDLPAAAK